MFKHIALLLCGLTFLGMAASQPMPQINPTQVCGGVVTDVSWNINAADRVTGLKNRNVVVSFTTQTALAYGDGITIFYPLDFFVQPADPKVTLDIIQAVPGTFLSCCNPLLSVTNTPGFYNAASSASFRFSVGGPNGTLPGSYTVTITGLTMGNPTPGSPTGVFVSTTTDLQSASAPSGNIGGQVQGVSMAIAVADRIPGFTAPVTISFTTQTILKSSDAVTITYPSTLLASGGSPTVVQPNQLQFLLQTPSAGTMTFVVNASQTVAPGSYTITLNGVVLGTNFAVPANQIQVVTTTDLISTTSPAIGGTVSSATLTIADADRVSNKSPQAGPVTVVFTTVTPLYVNTNQQSKITLNYPAGFFVSGRTVTPTDVRFGTATTASTALVLTVASNIANSQLPAGQYTIILNDMPLGTPTPGSSCGFFVSTSNDLVSPKTDTGKIGGRGTVTDVRMVLNANDRVPLSFNKPVTFSFTTQTTLASGENVFIQFPPNYFFATPAVQLGIVQASNLFLTTVNLLSTPAPSFQLTAAGNGVKDQIPNAIYTVTITGVTIGSPYKGDPSGISIYTSADASGLGATVDLGGQISAVKIQIAPEDRVPSGTNRSLTLSFTTATLVYNSTNWQGQQGTFSFVFRDDMIAVGPTPGIIQDNRYLFSAPSRATGTDMIQFSAIGAPVLPGSYTVTLTGLNFASAPRSASCTSDVVFFSTSDFFDVASFGYLGGTVRDVVLSVAPGSVPRSPISTTVTVAFTTQTRLSGTPTTTPAQTVTITLPTSYISFASSTTVAITCSVQGASNLPCQFDSNAALTTVGTSINMVLTVTSNGEGAPAGLYIVTFPAIPGPTGPIAAALAPILPGNSVQVITSADLASSSLLPAIGGQVSKIQISVASYASDITPAVGTPVTVSFTTQTPLTTGQTITVTFPNGYVQLPSGSLTVGLTCLLCSNTQFFGIPTIAGSGSNAVIVTLTGTYEAGSYVLHIGRLIAGQSLGSKVAICSGSDSLSVSTSTDLPGFSNYPSISGTVSNVKFELSSTVPYATGQSATVTFQTASLLSASNSVSMTFPRNYLMGHVVATKGPVNSTFGVQNVFPPFATVAGDRIVLTVQNTPLGGPSFSVFPGVYSVTFTGLTIGPPRPASVGTGFAVSTSVDGPGATGYPAIGGVVTGTALNVLAKDRIANANRRVVISFVTSTSLACGDTITVTFPTTFALGTNLPSRVTGLPVTFGKLQDILGNSPPTTASTTFVMTATDPIAAGSQSITICGLSINQPPIFFQTPETKPYGCGIQVTTNRDYTTVFGPITFVPDYYVNPSLNINFRTTTGVSMTIPWANRVAASTGQSVVFTFKTATELPAGSIAGLNDAPLYNYVAVRFPNDFFVKNAAAPPGSCTATPSITVQGLPSGYEFADFYYQNPAQSGPGGGTSGGTLPLSFLNTPCVAGTAAPCNSFVMFSRTRVALLADSYTVTVSGMTFGAATPGEDAFSIPPRLGQDTPTGITVQTNLDYPFDLTSGTSSGPLSYYNLTSFTLPTCRVGSKCQSVVVSFMAPAQTIDTQSSLYFTFQASPLSGQDSIFFIGTTRVLLTFVTDKIISVRPVSIPLTLVQGMNTITLTGLNIIKNAGFASTTAFMGFGPFPPSNPSNILFSTRSNSAPVIDTSAGLTSTTSLVVADASVSAITNATISFSTQNSINTNDFVYVTFPTGFFVNRVVDQCTNAAVVPVTASVAPATCSIYQSCTPTFIVGAIALLPSDSSKSFMRLTVQTAALPAGPKTIMINGVSMGNAVAVSATAFSVVTTQDLCSAGNIPTPPIVPARPPPAPPAAPAAAASSDSAAANGGTIAGAVIGSIAGVIILVAMFKYREKIFSSCSGSKEDSHVAMRNNPL